MTFNIKDKSILFIGTNFHNYEKMITSKLEEFGANVTFYYNRPNNTLFSILHSTSLSLLKEYQNVYYHNLISKIKEKHFDYLFVITGFLMPVSFINKFKELNPKAKSIMYQWDADATHHYSYLIPYFDKTYSFDFEDCDQFNLKYLPLFYTDDLNQYRSNQITTDMFYMGSYLPERYDGLITLLNKYDNEYIIEKFLYLPYKSYLKIKSTGINLNTSLISHIPMAREEYLEKLSATKVMVDISRCNQTGLAMRVIEALSIKKKLLTSNSYIKNEPFYNPNNILIIDPKNPIIDKDFINSPFDGEPSTLSIGEWIKHIFSN